VVHAGHGRTELGELSGSAAGALGRVQALLHSAEIETTHAVGDAAVETMLWKKLLINAVRCSVFAHEFGMFVDALFPAPAFNPTCV
jgi:ketopantoate reductase